MSSLLAYKSSLRVFLMGHPKWLKPSRLTYTSDVPSDADVVRCRSWGGGLCIVSSSKWTSLHPDVSVFVDTGDANSGLTWGHSAICLQFLLSLPPFGISTIYDLGSSHLLTTLAGNQVPSDWSCMRTCWPWYSCGNSGPVWWSYCSFCCFWRASKAAFTLSPSGRWFRMQTGRFDLAFLPISISMGDLITSLTGVVRRHKRAKSESRLSFLAFIMAFLTVWTMRSANPFDWGYRGEDVMCWNDHWFANSLKMYELNCGPLSVYGISGTPIIPNSSFRYVMVALLLNDFPKHLRNGNLL